MRKVTCAVFLCLLAVAPARGQFPGYFGPPLGGSYYFSGRGYTVFGYVRGGYVNPYGFAPGYGWPGAWAPPTVIVVPPPAVVVAQPLASRRVAEVLDRLPQVPPRDELELLRVPAPPPLPKPDFADRLPLLAAPPAANKKEESERQIKLGKEAFAAGDVGLALERFQKAASTSPDTHLAHFLIAQAWFALGRFRESAAAIHVGLKLRPDWPSAPFNPRELYGPNVVDHASDLDRLRQALQRQPEEPALLFLYGYQLWFGGRRDEARQYLEKALGVAADAEPIQRFLNTL